MLQPLENMKEDHGLQSLVPAKWLSFSSLLETIYHEKFLANASNVDMLSKEKWIDASNENMLSCKKYISAYNINRPMSQV